MKNLMRTNKTLQLILIVLVSFGALVMTHKIITFNNLSQYEKEITEWKNREKGILTLNDSLLKEVNTLKDKADTQQKRANELSGEIDALRDRAKRHRVNSDVLLQEVKGTLPDTCDTCDTAIRLAEEYKKEADSLDVTLSVAEERDLLRLNEISLLRSGIGLLEVQNDSLRSLVQSVPIARPEKFLGFISLPSRKTTFIVGVATGVVATTIVLK